MNNLTPISFILPIMTLLGGWILGLLSSLILERLRKEQALQAKLFDQYLKVREEITSAVSIIIGKTRAQKDHSQDFIANEYVEEISRLFYAHYDFLPHEVAIEMICMYCCLLKNGKNIYRCDDRYRIAPLDLNNKEEVDRFIEGIALVNNLSIYAPSALVSKDPDRKKNAIIRYQAFSVLAELNKYFGKKKLMTWEKFLRKLPMGEKRN